MSDLVSPNDVPQTAATLDALVPEPVDPTVVVDNTAQTQQEVLDSALNTVPVESTDSPTTADASVPVETIAPTEQSEVAESSVPEVSPSVEPVADIPSVAADTPVVTPLTNLPEATAQSQAYFMVAGLAAVAGYTLAAGQNVEEPTTSTDTGTQGTDSAVESSTETSLPTVDQVAKLPETTVADDTETNTQQVQNTVENTPSADLCTNTLEAQNQVATPMPDTSEQHVATPNTDMPAESQEVADFVEANGGIEDVAFVETPAEEDVIIVGFREALRKVHPQWETEMPVGAISIYRHFYMSGINDMKMFSTAMINQTIQTAALIQQGLQDGINTMLQGTIVLTNSTDVFEPPAGADLADIECDIEKDAEDIGEDF